MPPYRCPEKESCFTSKFVRIVEEIITTKPDDLTTSHYTVVYDAGLLNKLREMVKNEGNNVDADAGTYSVDDDEIRLSTESFTLRLPRLEEARQRSITIFEAQSPGFTVKKHR